MPLKMPFDVGEGVVPRERFFVHKSRRIKHLKGQLEAKEALLILRMSKIQGRAHFVSFSSIIGSKIRSKCCKFCLRPDDFVLDTSDSTCLSDRGGNDTSKARNFHI